MEYKKVIFHIYVFHIENPRYKKQASSMCLVIMIGMASIGRGTHDF